MGELTRIRSALQRRVDAAIRNGGRILNLTDQAVAETVIRDYFRMQPAHGPRHIVDVGAAYGAVANVFLQDGWTADLFEPDPACAPKLERLVARYGQRARLFAHAVAGTNREAVIFHQNTIAGLSGLAPSPFGSARAEIEVRTVRLDSFLSALGVTAVDLLKIDTEGNDFDALDSHDFAGLAPALVFVEFSYYFAGQNPRALADHIARMAARGYAAVIFEYRDDGNFRRNDWTHRLVALHVEDGRLPAAGEAFGNLLFYRSGDAGLLDALATTVSALG